MSKTPSRANASRSVAVKSKLDYPVIDTDLHTIEYAPLLEDYIDKYPNFFQGTAIEAKLNQDAKVVKPTRVDVVQPSVRA